MAFLKTVLFFCMCLTASEAYAVSVKGKVSYPERGCGADSNIQFKIAGFSNYPPFSWSENKKYQKEYNGFIPEFVKKALNDMHIVNLSEEPFEDFFQFQKALLHGKADLSFSSYYIDEAKSGQDYVYPAFFGNPFVVLSRMTKKIDINDISELRGLKGIIRKDEEIEMLFRGILPTDTKLEIANDASEAFKKLLSGEVDFMISSPYAADAEARRFKIRDKLHFGSTVLRHIKYFIAFSKLSKCRQYKGFFSEKLAEQDVIKDKSKMEESIQRYIRLWEEMHKDEPPLEYTPPAGE